MAVITVFNGIFCKADLVVREVLDRTGYRLITDQDIVQEASKLSEIPESKIKEAFSVKTSVFERFTHEHERCLAPLRLALAQVLASDNLIIFGFVSHIIPSNISHVLRVCLIGGIRFRASNAREQEGLVEKDALDVIHRQDLKCAAWVNHLCGTDDPWSTSIYDLFIPMDNTSVKEATSLIDKHADEETLRRTEASKQAAEDFLLSARVQASLATMGHFVGVQAGSGSVTLTVDKDVLMLHREKEELKSIVSKMEGVGSVQIKPGENHYHTDIYRKYDSGMPSKVLLVDDEREFVQTVSVRLLLRDIGAVAVYDGESALKLIADDKPQVMILDLRMPGIDGIEVLRRVKEVRPEVEVIILTGRGTEEDKEQCIKLGAFAYFSKPINTDLLTESVKRAYEKVREKEVKNK
jgi:CheY-like chemotaxis protein/cytidylate kinase